MRVELTEIEAFIKDGKYYPARKFLLDKIPKEKTNLVLWEMLAETFYKQKYYQETYEILYCLNLIQPSNIKAQIKLREIEDNFELTRVSKFKFIEFLKLPTTTVAACLIFKNNIDTIQEWYNSLVMKVDQIIVINTGSTDGTAEFFENKEVTLVEYQWDENFSNARNAALPYIKTNWVIWVDSDEFLENNLLDLNGLQFIADYYTALNLYPILSVKLNDFSAGEIQNSHEILRMYPTVKKFHFIGRIHEQIVAVGKSYFDEKLIVSTGLSLKHVGYTKERLKSQEKMERNIKLLYLQIKEDNNNPAWWMYLGREYLNIGQLEKAISSLLKSEEKLKYHPNFNRKLDIYNYLVSAYFKLTQFELAKKTCLYILELTPNFPNALYYLNLIQLREAMNLLDRAFQDNEKIKDAFQIYEGEVLPDMSILNWRADYLKANILKVNGNLAESYQILNLLRQTNLKLDFQEELTFIESQIQKLNKVM